MTGFHDVQFPTDISYGATGGPQYLTEVTALSNGAERRVEHWAQPLARYNMAHGVKAAAQLADLIAFYRARAGRANGFRFKDWTDYQIIGQTIGTGDGAETDFQLIKSYVSGSTTITRTITRPVAASLAVYIDSVLQGSGYTHR